jgi:hypothetical protein
MAWYESVKFHHFTFYSQAKTAEKEKSEGEKDTINFDSLHVFHRACITIYSINSIRIIHLP